MLRDQPFDSADLRSAKPAAFVKPDRVKPELRSVPLPLDMHVRWFLSITREEEEPVGATSQHRRHCRSLAHPNDTHKWRVMLSQPG
jgi:hypothetical protein